MNYKHGSEVLIVYTVKDLLESSENLQIRLIGKNLGGGVDREIKGIRIIEELDIKKYMVGGELLLTSLKVFEKMSEEMFLFHLEELNKKKISGFIIKRNESIPSYLLDTLFKFCEENHIPVLEISQNQNYFRIIKYILGQIYSKEAANRLYFVSMHDIFSGILLNESNLNVAIEKVLILLNKMLDNPVAIYSSDYDCYASSEEEPVSFNIENGLKRYIPEVITKQQYFIQKREYVEYINKMQLFDGRYFYLVITEKNNQLNDIDFAGMEDAILTLQFALMRLSAEEELDKKYQKDLEYQLLAGTLSSEEEDEVANILGLNDTDDLRVITFRLLPKNKSGRFTSEQLRQTEIVEKELLRNLPKKYTTSNTNQVIYIYKKDEQISKFQFRLRIEELQKNVQNNLDKRNANAEFVVGIGKDVKGYHALKNSFSDSKIALDYIHVIQKIIGDENRFVVDCSKLGFFRVFADIKDKDKLLSYVPESLQKLYEFDKQKNGELVDTLECFLNNKQSLKQTSNKLFVHYRTVSYRLEKIKEISSMDFDNPEEILAVRNGLIIYRLIETM
ncbi:PucR family transcriptional regulator [Holdemanella biformis]|uniref:PucR family transcriptional regulator n=2 Tax=Holdemanella biformis TaxID=1735 RepID=A0A413UB53_9FIRM|nr:PucR family transcriptional regulator [Holdemanella biformis]